MDAAHHGRLVIGERGVIRQVLAEFPVEERGRRGGDHEDHRADAEQEAEETKDEAHPGPVRR
jgi:hypothetical protein